MTISDTKQTDITVYGATSFVAKHVLRYLIDVVVASSKDSQIGGASPSSSSSSPNGRTLSVRLAGRNATRLKAVRETLIQEYKDKISTSSNIVQTVISEDVVVADGDDLPGLQTMVKGCVVVLNCAGPYAKYSSKVVQACAMNGTDYVDITGETLWASTMRQQYGSDAAKSGARIISFCGYDSIPTDMAVFHAIKTLRSSVSSSSSTSTTIQIKHANVMYQPFGMANGGTIATAADIPVDLIHDFTTTKTDKKDHAGVLSTVSIGSRRLRSVPYFLGDPLCLSHPSNVRNNPEFTTTKNRFALAEWMNQIVAIEKDLFYGISMPFFMSVVNLKVVHASAVALGYGDNFSASERMLPFGFTATKLFSIMALFPVVFIQCCMLLLMCTIYIPVIGPRITALFPPGSGMPDTLCTMGSNTVYCKVEGVALNHNDNGIAGGKKTYNACVSYVYSGDAGNLVTAQCVSEAALVLVLNRNELPKRSTDGFGTPAELLGDPLLNRLKNTKVRPIEIKTSVNTPLI